MSFAALAWASKQNVGRASDKLILLAYADRHNEETGYAYPSIAALCEFSCLDRKTVIAAVARLEALGLLHDTGERSGNTRQIKVYRVNIGTVPKSEQSQKRNSSVIPPKQSQKRNTEPIREPISSEAKASSDKPARTPKTDPFPMPEGTDPQAWQDFLANRKAKHLPNTATAHKRLMDDLARHSDAEWPPGRLIEFAASRGWGGIYDPRNRDTSRPAQDNRNGNIPTGMGRTEAAARLALERIAQAQGRPASRQSAPGFDGDDRGGAVPLPLSVRRLSHDDGGQG